MHHVLTHASAIIVTMMRNEFDEIYGDKYLQTRNPLKQLL